MEFLLVFALFLVCFGFFVVWGRAHPRRIAARRSALAVRHGLSLVTHGRNWPGASPRAGGERPGRHIKFWSYTTGFGKARRHLDATAVAGGAHVPALAARSRPPPRGTLRGQRNHGRRRPLLRRLVRPEQSAASARGTPAAGNPHPTPRTPLRRRQRFRGIGRRLDPPRRGGALRSG